ncbi:myb-related transcription factor, partner of profilin-like [Pleurodeles waltl]|uniref:myb-related transcription factor, partner of profilin-like n=1 Tax=Pleurodeles waltl TaxID=8319 RepID=UPI003709617C
MSVPDSHKKKIWQDILNKINAIGVSHCTLDEVRKRWCDLRSRTKERVAERMREMYDTGGGPSTVPPPTAIETMVETTLEPESVLGIGDLDSSEPGTSKCLPQGPTNSATVQGEEQGTDTQEKAATDTAGECRTTPLVQSAPEYMDDPALGLESGIVTPGPMPIESRPQRSAGSVRSRQGPMQSARREDVTDEQLLGLEASLLQTHRLQNRHMRLMNRNLTRLQDTLMQGFANVDNQFTTMNAHMANMTTSIDSLVREMVADREQARRRKLSTPARLDRLRASL